MTENASVVSERLQDLAARGLDFSVPPLYVLDGGKALAAAVRRHAGEAAFLQRCQVRKRGNVIDHLPEEHKPTVKKKLKNAYAMAEYADAKRALERLHRELMELNPSAARSLEEGMEETLTVHRLRVPSKLRRTLASTNVIESAFSIVETVCSQREALALWRPHWPLGRLRLADGRAPVPQGSGLSGDSLAVDCAGNRSF